CAGLGHERDLVFVLADQRWSRHTSQVGDERVCRSADLSSTIGLAVTQVDQSTMIQQRLTKSWIAIQRRRADRQLLIEGCCIAQAGREALDPDIHPGESGATPGCRNPETWVNHRPPAKVFEKALSRLVRG